MLGGQNNDFQPTSKSFVFPPELLGRNDYLWLSQVHYTFVAFRSSFVFSKNSIQWNLSVASDQKIP